MKPKTFIALLRGINVAGRNRIPMKELRARCGDIGWSDVRTYIQSGNVVFSASSDVPTLEAALETAIKRHFGLSISVIVRSGADWPAYVRGNPFPDISKAEPNRVMFALSKNPPKEGAVEGLLERAAAGEQIKLVGDALWIYYPAGAGTTKLSPALFDRLVGSPVTARNWRTVLTIADMAAAQEA